MSNLPVPNFIDVTQLEGLHGSLKNKTQFIFLDDKGREWHVGIYDVNTDPAPLIEYNKYPDEYKRVAGTRRNMELFKKINKRMVETVKMLKYKKAGLSDEQASTAVRI